MNENVIIIIGKNEFTLRDLWMDIFMYGAGLTNVHPNEYPNQMSELQITFDYWLKEKLGQS